jgi:hypothetical protein
MVFLSNRDLLSLDKDALKSTLDKAHAATLGCEGGVPLRPPFPLFMDGPYVTEVLKRATAAVEEPDSVVTVSRYLSALASGGYRYGYEDADRTPVWSFYRFDGALYSKANDASLGSSLRELVVDTLTQAIASCGGTAGGTAPTNEADKKMQTLTDNLRPNLRLLKQHCDSPAWNHIWMATRERLQSEELSRAPGEPTPAQFAALLDANEALLGFNNGVFNLTDMTFYAAGPAFPRSRLIVSMSAGYAFIPRETLNEQQLATLDRARERLYSGLGADAASQSAAQAFTGAILYGGCSTGKIFLLAHGGDALHYNTSRLHAFYKLIHATMGDYAGALEYSQLAAATEGVAGDRSNCRYRNICNGGERGLEFTRLQGHLLKIHLDHFLDIGAGGEGALRPSQDNAANRGVIFSPIQGFV